MQYRSLLLWVAVAASLGAAASTCPKDFDYSQCPKTKPGAGAHRPKAACPANFDYSKCPAGPGHTTRKTSWCAAIAKTSVQIYCAVVCGVVLKCCSAFWKVLWIRMEGRIAHMIGDGPMGISLEESGGLDDKKGEWGNAILLRL
ncbi:hypothetical protein PpBr36_07311 [Pyricularia pennisetigena]|uniref:hypothetical protein n=1 Tax=Pyricularia pennisetigena TaxID=1578925 RepID=UPI001150B9B8|nr:hypothetical protein PpBr36_07311 [Pyricularia pennisetigena]TLS24986.1 hypothetical protein PpBr36_07311 [Pyricularia pennisetigena]